MTRKIDSKLLEKVSLFSGDQKKIECFVFGKNFEKLKNLLKKHKDELSIFKIKEFGFAECLMIETVPSKVVAISRLHIVSYISNNSSVFALSNVARKILRIDDVHDKGILGKGITIAYIDTGLSPKLDFVVPSDRVLAFHDTINGTIDRYDDNGHGTFVTGIGSGNGLHSGGQFSGVAPLSKIVSVKGLSNEGEANAVSILESMDWIFKHRKKYDIRIVSMSFGSEPLYVNDPIIRGADALVKEGIVVVAAAGNSGPDLRTIKSPGMSSRIITVGGFDDHREHSGKYLTENFQIADFSSRGPGFLGFKPDVVCPAVQIQSTSIVEDLPYRKMNGTSVATPIVAGLVALFLEKYPSASPQFVKQRLISSCTPITRNRNSEGFGVPDAVKFLSL